MVRCSSHFLVPVAFGIGMKQDCVQSLTVVVKKARENSVCLFNIAHLNLSSFLSSTVVDRVLRTGRRLAQNTSREGIYQIDKISMGQAA